ncbi:MAG: hypothetical protein RL418_472 [Actinomycetota bacterium]|jgi:hypothetical protein
MKTTTKIAATAAAALIAGAAFYAIPASAHGRTGSTVGSSTSATQSCSHATLSATITGIPSSVTSSHIASHGGYFTAYVLDDSASAVPSTEPTTGGKRIGLKPVRNADGSVTSEISGTTLTGVLGFHADSDGTTKLALYPSDGSTAVLVTVTTATDGTVSAVSSAPLTVAYSASVAAEAPTKQMGKGGKHGKGRSGGKIKNFSSEGVTPNA